MPLYEYECQMCSTAFDAMRSMEHRETAQCPSCKRMASQMITFPKTIDCILEPVYDEGLGQMITSSKHRKEVMRSKGIEEL